MKKTGLAFLAIFAVGVFLGPTSARAETGRILPITSDFFLTVGYKIWVAAWDTGNFTFTSQAGSNANTYGASNIASIPSVSLKYKRLLLSGSVLKSGEYSFAPVTDMISLTGAGGSSSLLLREASATRDELDANLGLYVTPNLAFTVGWKEVTQTFTTKSRSLAGVPTLSTKSEGDTNYEGPTLGIVGGAPIGAGFTLYGNFVIGELEQSFDPDPSGETSDQGYEAAEIGIAHKAATLPFNFSVGYKYQIIDNDDVGDDTNFIGQTILDVTRGFVFGFNLFF